MTTYAARAIPWQLLAICAAMMAALMLLVRLHAWTLWPLQGLAVGLLAGAVGWCLDEPAAAVVDAAPRGLAWRTAARGIGVALLAAVWLSLVWWARPALFGHPGTVAVQGLSAVAMAGSWVTWRRARAAATPGNRFATAVVPLTAAWALARPFETRLPIFPYGPTGPAANWASSTWLWAVAGAASLAFIVVLLAAGGRIPRFARAGLSGRRRSGARRVST